MKRVVFISLVILLLGVGIFIEPWKRPDFEVDRSIQSGEEQLIALDLQDGWTYKVVVEQCGIDLDTVAISSTGLNYPMDRFEDENKYDFIYLSPKKGEQWQIKVALGQGDETFGFFRVFIEDKWLVNAYTEQIMELQDTWIAAKKQVGDITSIAAARVLYDEVIATFDEMGDNRSVGLWATELGTAYYYIGQYQEALAYTGIASEAFAKTDLVDAEMATKKTKSVALNNLYVSTRSPQYAIDALKDIFVYLSYVQQKGDEQKILAAMVNIGSIFQNIGFFEEAAKILEASIQRLSSAAPHVNVAARNNLAILYYDSLNDVDRALPHVIESEKWNPLIPSKETQAASLNQIGSVYLNAIRYDKAIAILEQALDLAKGKDPLLSQSIMIQLAKAYQYSGQNEKARTHFDTLLKVSDKKGYSYYSIATLTTDPVEKETLLRQAYATLSSDERLFPNACLNLAKMTRDPAESKRLLAEAIAAVEAARSLYSDQNMRTGTLQRYFDVFSYAIERELSLSAAANDEHVRAAFETLDSVMGKSVREALILGVNKSREQIDVEKLKAGDQSSWELVYRQLNGRKFISEDIKRSLAEIQASLDPGTLLLMTYQSKELGYNWLVWNDGFRGYKAGSEERVGQLTAAFRKVVERGSLEAVLADRDGRELYQILFPISFEMSRFNRLAVVTDGPLTTLPFAALPTPQQKFLIQEMEIVYLPTASHATQLSSKNVKPAKAIAVFSNPVFSKTDNRLSSRNNPTASVAVNRAANAHPLPRLAGTERETKEILSLPSLARQAVLSRQGFNATRAAAMDPALANYRILHFATHCQIDPVDSSKSKLIFSCFDPQGRPIPSELTLSDISEMKLNAELVVLSACESALGKRVRGAGPMSISRGFMLAGVPRVAATLWAIDDKASPTLMKHFYTAMLEQGMTASAALCDAQRKMLADPQWRAPKYWSAFILLGDWR